MSCSIEQIHCLFVAKTLPIMTYPDMARTTLSIYHTQARILVCVNMHFDPCAAILIGWGWVPGDHSMVHVATGNKLISPAMECCLLVDSDNTNETLALGL